MKDIEQLLRDVAARNPGGTKPGGWYSPEGDCFFYYNEDGPHSRDRVDELLTVYRAEGDGHILGVEIKGIRSLPKHDLLGIRVESNKEVAVVTILLATYKRRKAEASHTGSAPSDVYMDACTSMMGERVAVDQLQLA